MKTRIALLFMLGWLSTTYAQEYRTVENKSFKEGEKLTYVIYFDSYLTGKIRAAYGTFEVSPKTQTIGGRECYHIIATGSTFSKWSWAIYVKDRFDSYLDKTSQMSWMFLRKAHEGKYKADQQVVLNHAKKVAKYTNNKNKKSSTYTIPTYTQDMISAGYYARNMDLSKIGVGGTFSIPYVFEDSVFTTNIIYDGEETIKIDLGTFKCKRYKPKVQVGNVFSSNYPISIYFTDDENKIPIFAKGDIKIGNVKFELYSYENIKNPLTSKVK